MCCGTFFPFLASLVWVENQVYCVCSFAQTTNKLWFKLEQQSRWQELRAYCPYMCIIVLMEVKLAPWVGLFFAITDYRRPPTSIFIPPAENVSNKAWFLGLGLFKIYPVVFHITLQNNNYCLFLASCFSNQNYGYNFSCIFSHPITSMGFFLSA